MKPSESALLISLLCFINSNTCHGRWQAIIGAGWALAGVLWAARGLLRHFKEQRK